MTVLQAQMLQSRYTDMHPGMRQMDLSYRLVSKGGKGLWKSADKPKPASPPKPDAMHPLLRDQMIARGWTPPAT